MEKDILTVRYFWRGFETKNTYCSFISYPTKTVSSNIQQFCNFFLYSPKDIIINFVWSIHVSWDHGYGNRSFCPQFIGKLYVYDWAVF